MPIIRYIVRWPDGAESDCYSPSVVIQDYLQAGQEYVLDDFVERIRNATAMANDRVQARFGFVCWSANDQLRQIEIRARSFADRMHARVHVVSLSAGET